MDFRGIELPEYSTWSCAQWQNFHEALKARFGRAEANRVWSEFFNRKPVGWTADKVCTSNESFRKYFRKQGIEFDASAFSILKSVVELPVQIIKYAPWVLGGVAVLALVFGGVYMLTVYRVGSGIDKIGSGLGNLGSK